MNILFVVLFKRVLSDVLEGVTSTNFSLALLSYSVPPFFCVDISLMYNLSNVIIIMIITFFKLQFHSHITKIQLYVSPKLGNVQLAVRLTT